MLLVKGIAQCFVARLFHNRSRACHLHTYQLNSIDNNNNVGLCIRPRGMS